MKNTTDINGNGSGTMKTLDRLFRGALSQRIDTDPETKPGQENRKRKFSFFAHARLKKEKNKEMPSLQ